MKNLFKAIVIVSMFFMVSYTTPAKVQAQGVGVTYQVFYDQLSPYGSWVNYGSYGYVWIPYTEPGFSPYSTNGYWAWTDYGWTWVSYYQWGWGPFHYGRWDFDPFYGWFWVPGYEWAPAWVCWRHAPGYYGWAPIAPGISMTVVIGGRWHPHHDRWLFMHEGYMGDHYIDRYYVPRAENDRIIRRSGFIRDTYNDRSRGVTYVTGPRRTDVEKRTGKPVQRMEIVDRTAPGHSVENNRMDIYRPRVEQREDTKPAPKKVEDLKNVPGVKTREENYRKNPPQNREQQQQEQKRTEPQRQPEQKTEPRPQQQREEPQRKPDVQPQQQPQKRPDEVQPNPQREQPQRKPDVQPQQPQREQPQRKPDVQPQQQPQKRPDEVQPNPQREQPQRKPDVQPQQPQREQPQRKPDVQPQQQPERKPDVQPNPQREQPQRKPDVQPLPQRQPPQQQPQRQQPQRQP
jgi:hypothetical protein